MYEISDSEYPQCQFFHYHKDDSQLGDIGYISADRLRWISICNIFDLEKNREYPITNLFDFSQQVKFEMNETHEREIYIYRKENHLYDPRKPIEHKADIVLSEDLHIDLYLAENRKMFVFIAGPNIKKRTLSVQNDISSMALVNEWVEINKKSIYKIAFEKMKTTAPAMNRNKLCFVTCELKCDSYTANYISKGEGFDKPFSFKYKDDKWHIDNYKRGRADFIKYENCISASWNGDAKGSIEYPFLFSGLDINFTSSMKFNIMLNYYIAKIFRNNLRRIKI